MTVWLADCEPRVILTLTPSSARGRQRILPRGEASSPGSLGAGYGNDTNRPATPDHRHAPRKPVRQARPAPLDSDKRGVKSLALGGVRCPTTAQSSSRTPASAPWARGFACATRGARVRVHCGGHHDAAAPRRHCSRKLRPRDGPSASRTRGSPAWARIPAILGRPGSPT